MRNIYIALFASTLLISCGGSEDVKEDSFKYYSKEEATNKSLELSIEASGEIEAISTIEIKSKASGEVLFLGAEVGDYIQKGSILARIDQRTPNNILAQAEADLGLSKVRLENAKSQLVRGEALHSEGSIADKDFEDIQENYASAQSAVVRTQVSLENANISLDDTIVRSPTEGTIISRSVEVGQVISSPSVAVGGGTVLMRMADLGSVRVRALVDEIDVGKVRVGQDVSIKVSAYRDRQFFGKVAKIEPLAKVEQNVTLFPILIDIENKENLLLLGMNTDVIIQILDENVSLSIPTSSLRTRKDIKSAAALLEMPEDQVNTFLKNKVKGESFNKFIVIKDSKAGPELKWVQIGKSDLSNVEVVNGLNRGDQVFVLPSQSLVDYQEKFRARVSSSFGA
ncbi:MAG: efflux RND transporter periplasmic adaptor subunit [SAR86 cluster bacterium]|jgi:HlyD family secretion protein|uniref:Efflux RND transporter periplasmic adaptor subunit n=1 Tax=SAR86 cluster bacterium TaxID=2030880 RepID=A0A937J636_9GAMM|nr:efflux RND transporter periplasmic adaptor subunit [SAR86 cluster bacterium]MDG1202383.1 efflux RND transporter periplasmic adaptor subunit [SAR86 cluster bacterium]MDG1721814.1 efflux RND transporter periplasmic adaptor subunit [SAR86 cluster bacterium]